MYWKAGLRGYAESIAEAGRYTREEAEAIVSAPYVEDYIVELPYTLWDAESVSGPTFEELDEATKSIISIFINPEELK